MNAITRSCVLFLWMHTLIFVESQEIECTVPNIANGLVTGDIRVYKEHEILHYECNPLYKRTEGRSSKCTKVGTGAEWSPTPMCEPIKCQLNLPPIEGTTYEPAGRSLFLPGDEITVRCEKKFWIFNMGTTSVRTTCNEFGDWTTTPVCKEVICTKYDPFVTSWTKYRNQIKLDETTGYECVRNYKRPVGITEATCTRDGWSPKPLCQEIKCNRQPIENADFVNKRKVEYKFNERIDYVCTEGYKGNPHRICRENGWTGNSRCTEIECTVPNIANGLVTGDIRVYKEHEILHYECNPLYKRTEGRSSKCTKVGTGAEWSPTPMSIECTVPDIENGFVTGDDRVYKEHEILHYQCNPLYKRTEGRSSKCTKVGTGAEWSPAPMCESIKCQLNLPPIEGTTYEPAGRSLFLPGDEITVRCEKKFWIFNIRTTSVRTTCNEFGEWTTTPVCKEVICTKYDPLVTSWTKWTQIKLYETTGYECVRNYKRPVGITEATCTRDGWSPNPLCQEIKCIREPIENADFVNKRKVEYKNYERIDYACTEGYKGNPSRICRENGWTGNSRCTAITCEDCPEPVGCETPPFLTDGDLKYTVKSNYSNNERVEYMCQSFYTMEGEPYRTCINGEWTGHMRCLKPCVVNEDDFRQHNITLKSSDNKYFTHDEIIEFRCARGTPVGAVAMRQRCNSGVVLLPTCQ